MTILALILASLFSSDLFFKDLPIEDSGINVLCICQDGIGNIWFGGMEGITRYDGSRYTHFKHASNTDRENPDCPVYDIMYDSDGIIWVSHVSGLCRFDSNTSSFRNFTTPGGPLREIVRISDDHLLAIAGHSLWVFDTKSMVFTQDNLPEICLSLRITALYAYAHNIYIGTADGRCFVLSDKMSDMAEMKPSAQGSQINCFLHDSPGHIWVGTEEAGLWKICLKNNSLAQFPAKDRIIHIKSLCTDDDGALWIGTKNGLHILKDGQVSTHLHHENMPGSITHNSIGAILKDRQGTMWLGTYYGGVCYYTPHSSQFSCIVSDTHSEGLHGSIVSDIVEDADGSIWIGTNSGGLNRLLKNGRFEHIKGIDDSGSTQIDVKCIYISPLSGHIYVGADRAELMVFDRAGRRLKRLSPDAPESCYAIESDGGSGFYIGCSDGLHLYNERTGNCSRIYVSGDNSNLKSLKLDSRDILWIGRKSGITALDRESGKVKALPEEMYDIRYAEVIIEDSKGNIWIGSRDGLFMYDPSTHTCKAFTEGDGVPDHVIHGIEEDTDGVMWVSTNHGLFRLNPQTGEKWTFTTADGLLENRFTTYAHCRTKDGKMYFGSLHGLVCFDPKKITMERKAIPPVISGIEVNGVWRGIPESRLVLKPKERDITFTFSSPDYISGKDGRFFYKMEGVDHEWQEVGKEWRASYHDLSFGEYTFMLLHLDSSGVGDKNITIISLKIRPHWYETVAAKLTGIILLLLAVVFIISWQITRKEKKYKGQMEKMRNDLLRDFSLEFVGIGANKSQDSESSVTHNFDESDEKFMRRAMTIVKENMDNPEFAVDDFAEKMFMSRSNLNLKVKALFGTSPLELIKTVRFNEACRLLLERKHSISEIGYMVGFATPSYFAVAFKRFLGCTPSEYLKKKQ